VVKNVCIDRYRVASLFSRVQSKSLNYNKVLLVSGGCNRTEPLAKAIFKTRNGESGNGNREWERGMGTGNGNGERKWERKWERERQS
jgi:hypothetical protein